MEKELGTLRVPDEAVPPAPSPKVNKEQMPHFLLGAIRNSCPGCLWL